MEFCPKCGTLMLPTKSGKTVACPKDGYRAKTDKDTVVIKEKTEKVKVDKKKRSPKEITDTFPVVDAVCGKCGNTKAFWWTEQVTSALGGSEDLPETQFFRCTKCNSTWRKTV
jgi:DNA-directed RNA polymerase subunit M